MPPRDPAKGRRKGIVLAGDLSLVRAREVRTALLAALEDGGEVPLDLSGVTGTDLGGLQLLCAAYRTAVRRDGRLALRGDLPEPLVQAAREAGLCFRRECPADRKGGCPMKREVA